MSFRNIHLNKLIRAMGSDDRLLTSMIRSDIRADLNRNPDGGGGDFYIPFWSDAKSHVGGETDLTVSTEHRIEVNSRRSNLYPLLRDGFLEWWDNRRLWTNEELTFQEVSANGNIEFIDLDATVKVQNLMGMRIGGNSIRLIYPYYYPEPVLSSRLAQLALWGLGEALTGYNIEEIRILDVIRSNAFTVTRSPLIGNEEDEFTFHYRRILNRWDELRQEYPNAA